MAGERIPDAALGSAPGLEIRGHAGRMPASEGGQSLHSIGSSVLSEKGWEGLPIAVKTGVDKNGKNEYTYFDQNEKELTREQAYRIADGVVFYQTDDPLKWSVRQRGKIFAHDKVKAMIEKSRAHSDVANLQDLQDLPTIKEEEPTSLKKDAKVEATKKNVKVEATKKNESRGLIYLAAPILLFALAAAFWPAAKHETVLSNSGQQGRSYSSSVPLEPALDSLLRADEFGEDEIATALLDMPTEKDDRTPRKQLEKQAAAEIDRILSATKESDILGPGPSSAQQREFLRIVKLLHPDKGLVSAGDKRADIALRLAFAARRRALKKQ